MSEAVFGLIGVVIGGLLTQFQELWAERRDRNRSASYLAIRVVCVLDQYVEHCAAVVADDGLCEGQRDEEGCLDPQVSAPPPPEFPADVDWRSIDASLMYRLQTLPGKALAAAGAVSAAAEFAFPPDYEQVFEERQDQYGKLGLAAHALASEIRKKYGLPGLEASEWNPADEMTTARQKVREIRQRRAQSEEAL